MRDIEENGLMADGILAQFTTLLSIQPVVRFQCSNEEECLKNNPGVNTSSEMVHDQGKCSALLTREGFFDFLVFKTQCSVPYNVAVVCQHNNFGDLAFSSNISDIKLSMVNNFHSLQVFSSCDPGWFKVDDVCINFYMCPDCRNNWAANNQCKKHGGQLAHRILNNVTISTPGNILDKSTKLSLFWDLFPHTKDISPSLREILKTLNGGANNQKNFAVNGSDLCATFNISSWCTSSDIVLSVSYNDVSYLYGHHYTVPTWSVLYQPIFQIAEYKTFLYV